ncbi:MAG: hypothetical protein INH12_23160 [Cupriavidus sp.]|nr:hypothetical protein [Cupriavidus sp.]QWE95002.1 hypothetical protein KLP38_03270 [Cupriavidus sp. EM10]MCA3192982.1 hypothetical protein [Cupriavidus sp.]MCA3195834.1 hypothetical protein [Cupriavidus sp.]MCA3204735.1 hypothetical protein [Cupriavidus sp.]
MKSSASRSWDFYGKATIPALSQNPYRALLFADWAEVDRIALTSFNVPEDASARLIGACHATLNESVSRGKSSVSLSSFRESLNGKLDTEGSVGAAIGLGSQCGAIHHAGPFHFIGAGIATVERNVGDFVRGFTDVAGEEPRVENGTYAPIESLRQLISCIRQNRIVAIDAPSCLGTQSSTPYRGKPWRPQW